MSYDCYDDFAFFYNKYWTFSMPYALEKVLKKILFPVLPKKASVIDLCCGTGNMADIISKYGFNVYGVDGSLAMLAYAKINAPKVEFIHQDIRNLDIEERFDCSTCLFDSINHIIEPEDVIKTFSNVYNILKDKGVFIFDVNSETAVQKSAEKEFHAVDKDDVCICNASYDMKDRMTTFYITTFLLDNGVWNRSDIKILEKYYSNQEIVSMLHASGFSKVTIYDGCIDLNIKFLKERNFFMAEK